MTAGRYDGMDFPGDTCRVEVVPEVPIATSDLEEFVSSYLRDAPFAEARFAQRVAQALGRCNRGENDRAVYLLTDPEFLTRFSQRRVLDSLPPDVSGDVYAALERADDGIRRGLEEKHAASSQAGTTRPSRRRRAGPLKLPRRRRRARSMGSSRSGTRTTVVPPQCSTRWLRP